MLGWIHEVFTDFSVVPYTVGSKTVIAQSTDNEGGEIFILERDKKRVTDETHNFIYNTISRLF